MDVSTRMIPHRWTAIRTANRRPNRKISTRKVVNFETLPYHRLTGKTIGKNAFTSKKLGKTFFAQKQQNIESFEMNMAL